MTLHAEQSQVFLVSLLVCRSVLWMAGMRHAWVRTLECVPCVGFCVLPTPTPQRLPLRHHIKHYLLNNTIMGDKASFQRA